MFTYCFVGDKMKFNAVFFDLDGTLADSLVDLANCVNHVLEQKGFPVHSIECYKYFAGDGILKMIERAVPAEYSADPIVYELKDQFMEYYSQHYADNTVAYDGLDKLIDALKQKGIKIAVVTNKAQEMAEKVVYKLFGDSFDYILGLREGIPAKPDPTGILMAMKELEVAPDECAFVGDTGMDVAGGVNAGAYPIGVLWGFREKEELAEFGAEAFASTAEELLKIIIGEK